MFGTFWNTVPGLGVRNVPEQPCARRFGALRAPYQIRKVRFRSFAGVSSVMRVIVCSTQPYIYNCARPGTPRPQDARSYRHTRACADIRGTRHEARGMRPCNAVVVADATTARCLHACHRSRSVVVPDLQVVVRREVGLEGVGRRLRGGGDRAATRAWRARRRAPPQSRSRPLTATPRRLRR